MASKKHFLVRFYRVVSGPHRATKMAGQTVSEDKNCFVSDLVHQVQKNVLCQFINLINLQIYFADKIHDFRLMTTKKS